MTEDLAAALSLIDSLPRIGLADRLRAADPTLLELAESRRPAACALLASARHQGIGFVAWNTPDFPALLRELPDMPPGLWYRGRLAALDGRAVAIVGSRSGSAVALETAFQLGRGLAAHGVTVVSGLARGVDSAAHRGALDAGGVTAAVLGSGLAAVYPAEHRPLADAIATAGGVVLSEYPPDAPPLAFHFPLRNRLISGLSRAVVVIEAAEGSGSLITASCAVEQGRDVMAVPGNVLSGRNKGGHALIRDGAPIVESAEDILIELGWPVRDPASDVAASSSVDGTSAQTVLNGMEIGTVCDLDALAAATGHAPGDLLVTLTSLELEARVRRVGSGGFIRTS